MGAEVVTRKAAIKEVMRLHHVDKRTAAALVDAAIQAEQRKAEIMKPYLKNPRN